MSLPTFSMRQLLEAGVHFGHQTHRWNPKMKPYIFGERNGVHIIDLSQTVPMFYQALEAVRDIATSGGRCCSSAPSARRRAGCGGGQALRPVLRQPPLARRHADQLEDDLALDPASAQPRGAASGRREFRPDQEGTSAAHPRARKARAQPRRHQGNGRPAGHPVRDRHQQGRDRDQGSRRCSASRSSPCSTAIPIPDGIRYPIPGNDDALRAIELYCELVSQAVLEGIQEEIAASGGDIGEAVESAGRGRRQRPLPSARRGSRRSLSGFGRTIELAKNRFYQVVKTTNLTARMSYG